MSVGGDVIGHDRPFFTNDRSKNIEKVYDECSVISTEKRPKISYFSLTGNSLNMWEIP